MTTKLNRSFPHTRLRRMRQTPFSRRLIAETKLTVDDLILPVFILEGEKRLEPISSMPGVARMSIDLLLKEAETVLNLGTPAIALFPVIDASKKSLLAEESFHTQGLV